MAEKKLVGIDFTNREIRMAHSVIEDCQGWNVLHWGRFPRVILGRSISRARKAGRSDKGPAPRVSLQRQEGHFGDKRTIRGNPYDHAAQDDAGADTGRNQFTA